MPPSALMEALQAIGRKVKRLDSLQKMIVGVPLPARLDALVKLLPSFMVFFRIELVSLLNVKLTAVAGFLYKRGVPSSEPDSRGRPRHFTSTLSQMTTSYKWCSLEPVE